MSQRTTRRRPAEGSASTSTNAADAPGDAVVLDAAGVAPRRPKNGKAMQADAAAPRQVADARSAARLDDASDDDDEIDDGLRKDAKLQKLALQLRANLLSGFFTPYDQFRAKFGVPRSAYEAIGKGTTSKLSSPAHLEDDRRAAADLLHQPALRDRVLRRGRRSRRERRTACHCAVDAARAPLRRALGSVGRRAAASPLQHVLTSTVTSHSETVDTTEHWNHACIPRAM